MVLRLLLKFTVAKFVQLSKEAFSIVVMFSGRVSSVKPVFLKAFCFIAVMVVGKSMVIRLVQS